MPLYVLMISYSCRAIKPRVYAEIIDRLQTIRPAVVCGSTTSHTLSLLLKSSTNNAIVVAVLLFVMRIYIYDWPLLNNNLPIIYSSLSELDGNVDSGLE